MAGAILGSIGAKVGGLAAGTFGWSAATWSQIGWTAGVLTANYLFAPDGPDVTTEGPRLDDLRISTSTYGKDIPDVFGAYRISGNIIWALPINETRHETREEEGKGGGGSSQTNIWYTYDATFAVAFCEGPISGVRKIWFDSKLVYDNGTSSSYDNITIYLGEDDQEPDWRIQADKPDTPAFRHVAYIVFNNVQLKDHGNRIPNVTAEIIKNGNTYSKWEYQSVLPYDIIEDYVPPRGFGYGSGIIPDIIIDDNPGFVYHPLIELNSANSGPLIHLVKTDLYLNYISTKIINYAVTGNFGLVPVVVSDSGYIMGIHSPVANSTTIYTNTLSKAILSSFLPFPNTEFDTATHILYTNDKIFLYDSEDIDIDDPPILLFQDGVCDATVCNVLTEWVSSANMVGMKTEKVYAADGMIFVIGSPQHLSVTDNLVKVWDTDVPNNLLYSFVLPELYTSNSQYLCTTYYKNFILYVTGLYSGTTTETLYGIDIRTGQVVEEYEMEMPASNIAFGTSRMVVHNGKVYLHGITKTIVIGLTKINNDGMVLSSICEEICLDSGFTSDEFDFSEGTDSVEGYVVTRNMSARAAIEPLLSTYDYCLIENNHKINLKPLNTAPVANIPEEDLGANSRNNIEYIIKQESELLRQLTIRYANNESDYQISTQSMLRIDTRATEERTVELALALTDDKAKQTAEKQLYNNWLTRRAYNISLSPQYMYLVSGDIITINLDGSETNIRLTKITITDNNIVNCSAIFDSSDILDSSAQGSDTGNNFGVVLDEPTITNLVIKNTPSLSNTYINTEGVYLAANGYGNNWKGCNVYTKPTASGNYTHDLTIVAESVIGTVHSILSDGPTHVWDLDNTLDVSISRGNLSSSTLEGVINGYNFALVGDEIIQFVNVTQVDKIYTLDTLLRGRRGTEHRTNSHAYGESFVLLNPVNFLEKQILNNDIYATITFGLNSIHEYGAFQYNGENLKPFEVSMAHYYRVSNTNIVLEWQRRSRYIKGYFQALPLSEATELYAIDVYQNLILKNSYTSTTETFDYDTTKATADSVLIGATVEFDVSQVSDIYGNGYAKRITSLPYDDGTLPTYIKNLNPHVYWRLDEVSGNALDSSTNNYTGIVGATVTQGNTSIVPSGDTNYAFVRNSTSNVASTTAGNMNFTNYSYVCSFKLLFGDSGGFPIFKGSGQYEMGLYNGVASGSDKSTSLAAYHKDVLGDVRILGFSGGQLLDTWNHFVVTYDGSTLKTYLNGVAIERPNTLSVQNLGNNFNLNKGYVYSYCEMGDVAMFPTALTSVNVLKMIELSKMHTYNSNEYSGYVDNLSPINYWKMDERLTDTAYDSAGSEDGLHSRTKDCNTRLLVGDNSIGKYYAYNTSLIYATNLYTSLRFDRTDTYSYSFRMASIRPYLTAYTSDVRVAIGSWDGSTGFYISVNRAGNLTFRLTNTASSNDLMIVTTNSITSDRVHSIAITYDGTGTSSGTNIYIDGTLEAHTATYDTLTSNPVFPHNTYIGDDNNSFTSTHKFLGYIGQLSIYDKILTTTEISDLHDIAIGNPAP